MSKVVLDNTGREIKEGDLLRIFHYKDRRTRRNVYLYKLVVRDGGEFVCVDACWWALNARVTVTDELPCGRRCPLSVLRDGRLEIIDGIHVQDEQGGIHCWYDRKKAAKPEDE